MGWLSLALGLVKLAGALMDYIGSRQLIHAGKAEAIAEGLKDVTAFMEDAAKGADGMRYDSDWSKRVRDRFHRD